MRISDTMMVNDYLNNISLTKNKVDKLQVEIATGNKIQQPSDSPTGTAKILSWNNQISQANTYQSDIQDGLTFLQDTTLSMQNIQSEVTTVMTKLTSLKNVANQGNLSGFADQIEASLNTIVQSANSESGGKYVFGGTDTSSAPYGLTSDSTAYEQKPGDITGKQNIKLSATSSQQINFSGTDVFGTIIKQNGNLDSTAAVGTVSNTQTSVYDAQGNQYDFKVTYTKTAANTYNMTYDITDSGGTSVFSSAPAAKQVVFNSSSGRIQTIDGQSPDQFRVSVPSKKIDFMFNTNFMEESSSATSVTYSANQKTSIFNTLKNIVDGLRNGTQPTDAQVQAVSDFNDRILDNVSSAGNRENRLNDANDLLTSQVSTLKGLVSNVQNVDVASAVMDLQNQNTVLQYAYKLASSILPKSLLDYI